MIARVLLFMLLAACAEAADPSPRENWTLLVEIYTVPETSAQLGEIFDARGNLLPGVEAAQARDRARAWHAAGSAELHGVQALTMQPGDKSGIVSLNEVLLPAEIITARVPGVPSFPASLFNESFGTALSITKKERARKDLDQERAPFSLTLLERRRAPLVEDFGLRDWARGIPSYSDETSRAEATCPWLPARVEVLVLKNRGAKQPAASTRKALVGFLEIVRFEAPPPPAPPGSKGFQCVWTIVSAERASAVRIVSASHDGGAWPAARAAVAGGAARIEELFALQTKEGKKADVETTATLHGIPSLIAPKYLRLPRRDAHGHALAVAPHIPATASTFGPRPAASAHSLDRQPRPKDTSEMFGAGWILSCEPFRSDEALTVMTDIQFTAPRGDLRDAHLPAHFPPLSIVEARTLETTVAVGVEPVLLGTLNPPPPNGVNDRADDGRAWLVFLATTPMPP